MINNNIRKLRTDIGLSQRQLAEKAGTSQQQVQRIEAGVQAARVDLAERLAAALGASLYELFPGLMKLNIKRPSENDEDDEDLAAGLGIELDPSLYTFRVRLRGGLERDFIVSAKDKRRLRNFAHDRDRCQIAVFDTPAERVAINMQALSFCQFLFDPIFNPEMENRAPEAEGDEREGLKVWLLDGGEPLWFGVDYDEGENDDEELGNLNGFLHDLETAFEDKPVSFVDEDGEEVILLSSHVMLCTVPLSSVLPALLDAEMEGEAEDQVETT